MKIESSARRLGTGSPPMPWHADVCLGLALYAIVMGLGLCDLLGAGGSPAVYLSCAIWPVLAWATRPAVRRAERVAFLVLFGIWCLGLPGAALLAFIQSSGR